MCNLHKTQHYMFHRNISQRTLAFTCRRTSTGTVDPPFGPWPSTVLNSPPVLTTYVDRHVHAFRPRCTTVLNLLKAGCRRRRKGPKGLRCPHLSPPQGPRRRRRRRQPAAGEKIFNFNFNFKLNFNFNFNFNFKVRKKIFSKKFRPSTSTSSSTSTSTST